MATAPASQHRADKGGGVGEYTFCSFALRGGASCAFGCVKVFRQSNVLTRVSIFLFYLFIFLISSCALSFRFLSSSWRNVTLVLTHENGSTWLR